MGSKTRSSPSTLYVLVPAKLVGDVVVLFVLLDATGSVDDGVSLEVAELVENVVFDFAGSVDVCELLLSRL